MSRRSNEPLDGTIMDLIQVRILYLALQPKHASWKWKSDWLLMDVTVPGYYMYVYLAIKYTLNHKQSNTKASSPWNFFQGYIYQSQIQSRHRQLTKVFVTHHIKLGIVSEFGLKLPSQRWHEVAMWQQFDQSNDLRQTSRTGSVMEFWRLSTSGLGCSKLQNLCYPYIKHGLKLNDYVISFIYSISSWVLLVANVVLNGITKFISFHWD
jgi:hypothetical protein